MVVVLMVEWSFWKFESVFGVPQIAGRSGLGFRPLILEASLSVQGPRFCFKMLFGDFVQHAIFEHATWPFCATNKLSLEMLYCGRTIWNQTQREAGYMNNPHEYFVDF